MVYSSFIVEKKTAAVSMTIAATAAAVTKQPQTSSTSDKFRFAQLKPGNC
jgi:hypothetical protein